MELDRRYAKSAKGREEIEHRGRVLTQGQRAVLILLDGKSTLRELHSRYQTIPTFADDVRLLFDQGYIEDVSPPKAEGPAEVGSAGADGQLQLQLIALATQLLGDHAAGVITRLHKAGERHEDLAGCLDACYKLIRLTIDESKAEQFREQSRRLVGAAG